MIKKFRPSIIFLMETKMCAGKVTKIRMKCGFSHELVVEPRGLTGGLTVWWLDNISLTVLFKSQNIIHVAAESDSFSTPKLISFVYGPPKEGERRLVWNSLRRWASSVEDPWLVMGDFNDLLSQAEKEGGNPRSLRKIINFQSLLSDCNLPDLEFKGSKYTWCNKRPSGIVRERLDRALGNGSFRDTFEKALVFHIEPVGSDHHALVIDCCYVEEKGIKPFKFEANWVQHENFIEIMKIGWNGVNESYSDKVLELVRRLNVCREKLVVWSNKEFPNFRKLISHLRRSLSNCYKGVISAEKLAEAEILVGQLEDVWRKEERYWWQRSRLSWLNCGDRNTKFFHHTVIQRRLRNKVLRLKGEDGVWLEEKNDINGAFSEFYMKLFTAGGSRPLEQVLSYVDKVVTDADNESLMNPVSSQEIEDAVFQLGTNKAPGPDGYSALFYQASWKEVSKGVCEMVKYFFEQKAEIDPINHTNIVLIPKVNNPEGVSHYRPLGLCNVSYKIIAKIMTNRMKELMSRIISPNQRAFIAGRMIQDNIILTHEAFHYLKHRRPSRKWEFALKMDMNKAYDRVE
ncbi:hypothetical protein QN277_010000 [Acacia crassicarpa]|uniref:Reverse transcriptase domain-containing protein n=1 Tax=Acacia crassicarpa TaxID=499986 RepID=A0AAE1M615_9FABA|nr:hypothetical protein QN277_010000 [Acacia crassicarpa]